MLVTTGSGILSVFLKQASGRSMSSVCSAKGAGQIQKKASNQQLPGLRWTEVISLPTHNGESESVAVGFDAFREAEKYVTYLMLRPTVASSAHLPPQQTAFYFAWMNFYFRWLLVPGIVGLVVTVHKVQSGVLLDLTCLRRIATRSFVCNVCLFRPTAFQQRLSCASIGRLAVFE